MPVHIAPPPFPAAMTLRRRAMVRDRSGNRAEKRLRPVTAKRDYGRLDDIPSPQPLPAGGLRVDGETKHVSPSPWAPFMAL